MKGRLIKAPKFNMAVHEPTPVTPSVAGISFSIGADLKGELTHTHSLSNMKTADMTYDRPEPPKKPPVKYVSQRLRLATTFKQELAKLGTNGQQLMDINPNKSNRSRANSPESSVVADERGLPFQRRARSFSPPKDNIQLAKNLNLFPVGPVAPTKFLSKPPRVEKESVKKLCEDLLASKEWVDCDSDEDLKVIKADYCRMLQQAPANEELLVGSEFEKSEDEEWQSLLDVGDLEELTNQLRRGRTRSSIKFL
jgi:hypothetical protein